jgi:mannose-6-phosphate isomerase-like protein (cupin superfamily)
VEAEEAARRVVEVAVAGRANEKGAMREAILSADPASEFFTEERCFILEMSNSVADEGASVARVRVEPGVTTQWHRLNGVDERYVLLEGEGRMEVGDLAPAMVGPGDVVLVPAGVRQRITNTGDGELLILCMCTPRFVPECYESLEE